MQPLAQRIGLASQALACLSTKQTCSSVAASHPCDVGISPRLILPIHSPRFVKGRSFLSLGSAMSVPDREADENVVFTGEMPSTSEISTLSKGYATRAAELTSAHKRGCRG
jgi:hypothetical protein